MRATWGLCLVIVGGCGGGEAPLGSDSGAGMDAPSDSGRGDASSDDAPADDAPGADVPGADAPELDAPLPADAPAAIDAATPMPCSSPGVSERVACGMCGTRERFCLATGFWDEGPCEDEMGECIAGTLGTVPCGDCGERAARCNASCAWEPTGACTGEGVCSPGAEAFVASGCPAGQVRLATCTDACAFDGSGTCEDASCAPVGAVETVACPTCGSATRTCAPAMTWTYGPCLGPTETCNLVDDDCDGASDEGCDVSCAVCLTDAQFTGVGGDRLVTATRSRTTGSCGGAGAEALLSFTLTSTSDVFVSTHGAPVDTVLYLRRCSCGGTEVACNDDADGLTTSVLELRSLAPGTYYVVADTETLASATFRVHAYISAPGEAGDRCGRPLPLVAGTTAITGDTCLWADDDRPVGGTSCLSASGLGLAPEGYYYLPIATRTTVTVDGCMTATTFDQVLYVRSVCTSRAAGAERACVDDACTGRIGCDGRASSVTVTLDPGLYFLVVDGYDAFGSGCSGGTCGTYDLRVSGL